MVQVLTDLVLSGIFPQFEQLLEDLVPCGETCKCIFVRFRLELDCVRNHFHGLFFC